MLEERELRRQLRPLGLAISEIPPDGHCLYRSLEDQLRQLQVVAAAAGAAPATVAAPGIGEGAEPGAAAPSFMELRAQAADYMRRHADHFMPFVLEVGRHCLPLPLPR
jgi:OTU domain-containing protein 6